MSRLAYYVSRYRSLWGMGGIALVLGLLLFIILPVYWQNRFQSHLKGCAQNLIQLRRALRLYSEEYGKDHFYPDANGALFLTRLFTTKLVSDPKIYLCPATEDDTDAARLEQMREGDPQNICSYAGRKNKNQKTYPGLYRFRDESITPMAGDDIDQPQGENHAPIILFLDFTGFIYENKMQEDRPYLGIEYLRDPLTN